MKILRLEIGMCYDCPYPAVEGGEDGFYYCGEAWNNDESGKNESDFNIDSLTEIPKFCPLKDAETP